MNDPAGCPPRSGHPWWAVMVYALCFLLIALVMYMDIEDPLTPVILDTSCRDMDKGQIIVEQGFNIQIVRCIPL